MKLLNIFKKKSKQVKYILGNEYIVNLEDIKISEEFKKSPPRPEKIKDKYSNYYYYGNVKGMSQIKIDVNGTCCDGYTTFLLARMMNVKEVKVLVC